MIFKLLVVDLWADSDLTSHFHPGEYSHPKSQRLTLVT